VLRKTFLSRCCKRTNAERDFYIQQRTKVRRKIIIDPRFARVLSFQSFITKFQPPSWGIIIAHRPISILPLTVVLRIPPGRLPTNDSCSLAIVDEDIPWGDVRMGEPSVLSPIPDGLESGSGLAMFVGREDMIMDSKEEKSTPPSDTPLRSLRSVYPSRTSRIQNKHLGGCSL
jgi:hypothetical protein